MLNQTAQQGTAEPAPPAKAGPDLFGEYGAGVTCASAVILLLAIATIDKLTGSALHVHMLYIFPVGLITWSVGRAWGLVAAVAGIAISVLTFREQRLYSEDYLYYWEAGIGLVSLWIVVAVLARLREALQTASQSPGRL